jgi:uncharacterized membrane protein YphA (DoxX/SURF4 family)
MGQVGTGVAAGLLIVIGASLLLGFLTPAVSLVAAIANLGIMLSWLPPYPWNSLNAKLAIAQLIVTSIAVAFLGPGAFSLDCRLFGRREINISKAGPQRRE